MIIEIPDDVKKKLEHARIQIVKQTLTKFNNNKKKASRYLGCSVRAIRYWVEKYPELAIFQREPHPSGDVRWDPGPRWKTRSLDE